MISEYLQFHFYWTLPAFLFLFLLARPFIKPIDVVSLVFLNLVAVCYTIPWDSFIIRFGIWSSSSVTATFLDIPYEEIAFFVIQTMISGLLCVIVFHGACPVNAFYQSKLKYRGLFIVVSNLILCGSASYVFLNTGNEKLSYLCSLVWWCTPPVSIILYLAGPFILCHEFKSRVLISILIPTVYLCIADAWAIKRSIWSINPLLTTGFIIPILELPIEEALFFLTSNVLVVFGYLCCMRSYSLMALWNFQNSITGKANFPILRTLYCTLLDEELIIQKRLLSDLRQCQDFLRSGSLSFSFASAFYPFPYRLEIQVLYSFLRLADDLVDDYGSEEAIISLDLMKRYLRDCFEVDDWRPHLEKLDPSLLETQLSILNCFDHVKTRIRPELFEELLQSFAVDAQPLVVLESWSEFDTYCNGVAGTVGEMIIDLCMSNPFLRFQAAPTREENGIIWAMARQAGNRLQRINIARDLLADAVILKRCYVPGASNLLIHNPEKVLQEIPKILSFAKLVLSRDSQGMISSSESLSALKMIPASCRIPFLIGCLVYEQIGHEIMKLVEDRKPPPIHAVWRVIVPTWKKIELAISVLLYEYGLSYRSLAPRKPLE